MSDSIDLYLISGFMGAGKTTLLQNILNGYIGERVGVVVNEFGAISVDGKTLEKEGIEIVEINNGSIFCACLKSGFVKTLVAFSEQPIDTLFIENSGLGDPSNFLKLLSEVDEFTKRKYQFKGAICVVDAEFFMDYYEIFTPIQNQIAASHFILVNKIDLVDKLQIEEIHCAIKEINSEVFIYDTSYGQLPEEMFKTQLVPSDYIGETSNHDWNRPASYMLSSNQAHSEKDLIKFLDSIKDKVLRLKGFLPAPNGLWHIDMVGDHYQIKESDVAFQVEKELVIIGKDSQDFQEQIIHNWKKIFSEVPNISVH